VTDDHNPAPSEGASPAPRTADARAADVVTEQSVEQPADQAWRCGGHGLVRLLQHGVQAARGDGEEDEDDRDDDLDDREDREQHGGQRDSPDRDAAAHEGGRSGESGGEAIIAAAFAQERKDVDHAFAECGGVAETGDALHRAIPGYDFAVAIKREDTVDARVD